MKTNASSTKHTAEERVSISLKSLIDLAKVSTSIKQKKAPATNRQSGQYNAHFKGRGMAFDESRLYQPGDDIRSLDWRVTARTGKVHTKVFKEERERPIFLSIDNRAAMHFATRGVFKSVQAAKLAALLAWSAHHHGDRIGGQLFSEQQCLEFKPQNGQRAVLRLLNALSKPTPAPTTRLDLSHALARLTHHAHPGSLVYILSDFRGLTDKTLTHIINLSHHCEVALLFIYDPLERQLPSQGQFHFTDELRTLLIDADDTLALNNYQQQFTQRVETLSQLARQKRISLLHCCTTDDPLTCLTQPQSITALTL
ncbi:MAG: DUF58 domain-containing protein [Methylococcaceae bacterium]|nr:MAG: DUF58 domain-containing protein [Methylococcaceae bacterium]